MTDQEMLDAARTAYHKLQTGSAVEEVNMGTYHAKFTRMNAEKLAAYISGLEDKIAGVCSRGAIGIIF